MIFWLLAGTLTALVVAVLLTPLLRRPENAAERSAYDQAIYRDQLLELQEDRRRGLLKDTEAEAARREIERRLLLSDATATASDTTASPAAPGGAVRWLAVGLVVLLLPLAGMAIYLHYGTPGLPGLSFAERQDGGGIEAEMLVAQLERRLAGSPEDAEGWLVLARVYERSGRFGDAAEAYRRIIALGRGGAEAHASLGEVLVAAAQGQIGRDARLAFAAAIEADPANPRARYYAGLAMAQDGRLEEALTVWRSLAADAPADAPWRAVVEQQIANAARSLGQEVPPAAAPEMGGGEGAARGPSGADIEAMQALSPEERAAFVRSMVEGLAARLEEQPDDPDGWLRLARSYAVLGNGEAAGEALARAAPLIEALPAEAPQRGALQQRLEALRDAIP
ncbi:c-type cytochrome biogenesis protein CcmI [Pelagibius litoralis]|uniref:C-type cytochrome biogenesis protein CcmI n=1 Tax=Pelagibius litoralis TaxID=374515 RepID=A0A967KDF7_9PROT|nr:c-type cytochrome biogenesis protein CcmI [Pelagibius litoralis]NIA72222.1 c-type cytochrome biogenesis protein CcmI [Pelagibius litoralis]